MPRICDSSIPAAAVGTNASFSSDDMSIEDSEPIAIDSSHSKEYLFADFDMDPLLSLMDEKDAEDIPIIDMSKSNEPFEQTMPTAQSHQPKDSTKPEERTKFDITRHKANLFPKRLFVMLEDAARCGFEDIVSWEDSGRSFMVHKHDEFVNTVMESYFSQTK